MQFLDKTGVGTLWSMCKTKFALKDHSHNYLPLSGGTLTGDLLFSNSGTTFRQIRGTCGDNDFWRIGGGATGNNAGYMEIATADDGTEPIYVRQYSGTFSTITRTATLLDGSGNTSFPGTVAAAKFKGALEGNASTATKSEYSRSLLGRNTSGGDYDANSSNLVFAEWNTMNDSRWYLKATGYECRVAYASSSGSASTASNASTVNGHTVNANVPSNAKFTDTNTWRPIQDNLTSTSTSESLSANQGRVLKGLVDGKANSSHTHNSLVAVGNEQISATAYGSGLHFKPYYSSGGPTTYGNILEYTSTNTGGGQLAMEWTGSQTENDGTDSNVGRVYYRSKRDCINGWTKWMTLAYINDIPTKLSQLTNDKGFVTGYVSGNTITINGTSTTWTNTWRGIQDNLTSSSTSDSLSANQGRILKSLVDGKANSSHTHTWSQISGVPTATTTQPGIMSSFDKDKLDSITYGANNYTLPSATIETLGGIKISPYLTGTLWPVTIDNNGCAQTIINGLNKNDFNTIGNIQIQNNRYNSTYLSTSIKIVDMTTGNKSELNFPLKSGTLALTSDIPDASNLCRFNFVNSISECKSDRINFLLGFTEYDIDLSDFDDYPDGTILLITVNENSVNIRHQSGIWYSYGNSMNKNESYHTYKEEINLITKNNGTVYHYKFS